MEIVRKWFGKGLEKVEKMDRNGVEMAEKWLRNVERKSRNGRKKIDRKLSICSISLLAKTKVERFSASLRVVEKCSRNG